MSSRSYDPLVARLTEYARRHPRAYRLRVGALALLGYAYLAAIFALLAAVAAGLVWLAIHKVGIPVIIKLAIPLAALLWIIVRSLWVRLRPPPGRKLRPAEAPRLMEEIERVRQAMQAPRVHHVLITDDFNAAVAQVPRLGVFGGYRVYLLIGLPLLGALPPDEFRAVLAHEFGHVSRAHGRFGAWLLRVRTTWLTLVDELDARRHPAQGLFVGFFDRYAPYFAAYTSVLSRAQEFEADEMAERISQGALGPALCRMDVASRYLNREFWTEVFRRTRTSETPPPDAYQGLLAGVRGAHAHPAAAEWLDEALREPTGTWDSHPATAERLRALGMGEAPPRPFETSAAEALLGPFAETLAKEMDSEWVRSIHAYWQSEWQRVQETEAALAALAAKTEPLTAEEIRERLWMTAELHGADAAAPLAQAVLDGGTEHAAAHYFVGAALARQDDAGALPHLERAMDLDREYTSLACGAAMGLLERLDRADEVAPFQHRWDAYLDKANHAQRERSLETLRSKDVFLPHGLDAAALAGVREQVVTDGVKRAYIVRKQMRHFPEDPCYVIGLMPTGGLRGSNASAELAQQVAQRLSLPGTSFVVPLDGSNRPFENAFRQVAASLIYVRPSLLARVSSRAATA